MQSETYLPKRLNMICLLLLRNLTLFPLFQLPGKKSFANKRTNRKAVSERGWGPLNYNLLLTAEIQNTSTQLNSSLAGTTTNSNVTPEMLNLTDGYSGSLTEKIVAFRKREDARNGIDADDHARKRKETAQAAIDQHKRITAGLHFAAGNCRLGPELWDHAKEDMKIQQLVAQDEKEKRANIRFQKMVDKVDAVRATGSYNVTELRILVFGINVRVMHQYQIQGNSCFKGTSKLAIEGSRFHEMHLLQHSFLILSMLLKMQVMLWPMGSQ